MKEVQFKDVKVGDKFTLNDIEYLKVQDKRVSCCKVLNAANASNPLELIPVKPLTIVSVDDQLQ